MKKISVLIILSFLVARPSVAQSVNQQQIQEVMEQVQEQGRYMLDVMSKMKEDAPSSQGLISPRTIADDGSLLMVTSSDWTSGFFPGELWYLYQYSNDQQIKAQAKRLTGDLEDQKFDDHSHDIGFKVYNSFGNGYRLTKNAHYRDVIIQAALTLVTRFNTKVGSIRSWDHNADKWDFPVIIDNMMNLELLFAATELSGDSTYYQVAVEHANTTLKNHFRSDYSSWHVVDYNPDTGEVRKKVTHQGYSNSSAWARGQAWGLYGFTMCYRETGNKLYLRQAEHIAHFILTNPNMPDDLIPYWDFDAPNIPNESRDASAATVTVSALYELSMYSDRGSYFREKADTMLQSLMNNYMADVGTNKGFLLKHSTGSRPNDNEVDVPLVYADYYFVEALMRKKSLLKNGEI